MEDSAEGGIRVPPNDIKTAGAKPSRLAGAEFNGNDLIAAQRELRFFPDVTQTFAGEKQISGVPGIVAIKNARRRSWRKADERGLAAAKYFTRNNTVRVGAGEHAARQAGCTEKRKKIKQTKKRD